jgi:hypothetical protein
VLDVDHPWSGSKHGFSTLNLVGIVGDDDPTWLG